MQPRSLSGLDDRDIADVLDGASRVAGRLHGARILVTGATGWFGTWLLDALVALDQGRGLGLSIVAVSRDPAAFGRRHPALHAAAPITWIEADVRDPLHELPGPFTHVIHAATESTPRPDATPPEILFDTIVRGTTHVLGLAALHPDARVLIVGSGAVYGPQPPSLARIAEDYAGAPDALDPASAYAEGKRAAELLAAIWHRTHGVHVTIARCFAFVGPHMPFDAHFAIGNFIRDAALGRPIRLHGDGSPRRSYLYPSDLVVALLTILVEGRPLRPYNVGGDEALTIASLAHRIAARVDPPVPVSFGGAGGGRDYVPDTSRITNELNLSARVSLDDAIDRTSAWFDAQRRPALPRPVRVAEPARC